MRDDKSQGGHSSEHKPVRREMSRRQFLSYTLGGTGAFLAAMPIIPMIRFTVDPLLQSKGDSGYTKVVEVSKVTNEPQEVKFTAKQVDGWYESEPEFSAFIAKDDQGNVFALSPVCKHLGCTIGWNTESKFKDEYYCPCHGAHYTKDGKQLAVASAPLDEYEVKVDNGIVYLGKVKPNTRIK
ncbi:QcrA and Rieske domain-containing protein [Paenibacillus sp. y28]|uniref:QcrA and Rieske domain-containing protein n=1 Tax=Paenibacillus sp. y28 TaxID=3129110 RepID=UPI003016804C